MARCGAAMRPIMSCSRPQLKPAELIRWGRGSDHGTASTPGIPDTMEGTFQSQCSVNAAEEHVAPGKADEFREDLSQSAEDTFAVFSFFSIQLKPLGRCL